MLDLIRFCQSQQIHETQILCITQITCHFVLNLWDIGQHIWIINQTKSMHFFILKKIGN
jgi:hypothetical protein